MFRVYTATDAELELLSINQRNVFVAHVCNNNSYEAIADHFGIALGTVKSRLHRARSKIALHRSLHTNDPATRTDEVSV